MFKEYLAKYLEELKASGAKVSLVEKNSLTMFALWLNKNAAQQSVQRTCANSADGDHHYFSNGNQYPNCLYCGTSH